MRKCGYCGGSHLKRVHRTFIERFSYLAIYECRDCENEEFVPRRYNYRRGEEARCPNCGTYRLTRLRGVDKIDKMLPGLLNRLEKMMGGNLYHCVFCRLQFYDRRKAAPRTILDPVSPTEAEPAPGPPAQAAPPTGESKPLIAPPQGQASPLLAPPETELAATPRAPFAAPPDRTNSDR